MTEGEKIVKELLRLSDVRPGESPVQFYNLGNKIVAVIDSAIEWDGVLSQHDLDLDEIVRVSDNLADAVRELPKACYHQHTDHIHLDGVDFMRVCTTCGEQLS